MIVLPKVRTVSAKEVPIPTLIFLDVMLIEFGCSAATWLLPSDKIGLYISIVPLVSNTALLIINLRSSHWLGSQVEAFCDLNKDPKYGCCDINSSVNKSDSPILDMNTLYLVDHDAKHIAYSVLSPSRYTGASKVNLVATVPFVDTLIWSGALIISENGKIFWVGTPPSIVLIWNVIGISISSLVWK